MLKKILVPFFLLLSVHGFSQSKMDKVFTDIEQLLSKVENEKMGDELEEIKISGQEFTYDKVAIHIEDEFGIEWTTQFTRIPWGDLSEHKLEPESSNDKITLVKLKFKKKLTRESFIDVEEELEDIVETDEIEFCCLTKDVKEIKKLIAKLYDLKGSQSPSNSNDSKSVIFYEPFSTNSNNWLEGSNAEYSFKVGNGTYHLEAKQGGYWFTTIPIDFNTNKDYEISVRINKSSGTDGYYFGLMLGYSRTSRYHHFAGITGQGNAVFSNKGNSPADLVAGNIYSAVKKGNNINLITVKKSGNTIRFFVNNQLIGETKAQALYGNSFGFELWAGNDSLKLEIDDMTIKGSK